MTAGMKIVRLPIDDEPIAEVALAEELGSLLVMRDWYRDFDVQDHKNEEAIAKAELDAAVFRAKRYCDCKSIRSAEIDKVVAAAVKATIATARRMKREEELRRYERKIVECERKAATVKA